MTKQTMLTGGTVENYKRGQKMFNQLAVELARPTILHHEWASTIPTNQLEAVIPRRLILLMQNKGKPINSVTNYEAMLYMSTVSMLAPLASSSYHIYVYLFRTCLPTKAKLIFSEYELNYELDISEQMELKNLKNKLYTKSIQLFKEKQKNVKR